MFFFIPETMGLSAAEKKRLFYPGAKYGRKLRPEETLKIDMQEETVCSNIRAALTTGSDPKVLEK